MFSCEEPLPGEIWSAGLFWSLSILFMSSCNTLSTNSNSDSLATYRALSCSTPCFNLCSGELTVLPSKCSPIGMHVVSLSNVVTSLALFLGLPWPFSEGLTGIFSIKLIHLSPKDHYPLLGLFCSDFRSDPSCLTYWYGRCFIDVTWLYMVRTLMRFRYFT